ncbi:piggyBac transposable element-derived protein 4-like [Anastrepha obliqua]|uniref:piggyBac transposable element-derived protein 4-like n=1 Tax=Anastrepha obliqua TaxID=95512 RepID=UPI00240A8C26|nr:piggyBac transposable element-derived protein 4-like [Anastrepha obliqua]
MLSVPNQTKNMLPMTSSVDEEEELCENECTNQRLKKLNKQKKTNRALIDEHEIMVFLGVAMIMHYNHLPSLHDYKYWSKHASMGNEMIKQSISRDRFTLLASKLYLNDCDKPDNDPKDYYISEVVSCMKEKFMRIRSDSPFQSIDECMAKFKGRSSLKQYMPMKPIKRGVKIWLRCDAKTGYTYDLNVYTGKDVTTNFLELLEKEWF